jgi:hypothetical protein
MRDVTWSMKVRAKSHFVRGYGCHGEEFSQLRAVVDRATVACPRPATICNGSALLIRKR